jgi:hypothetical protein
MDVNSFEEPAVVYPESEFERALAPLFDAGLRGCRTAVVVPRFGLDFAVFVQDNGPSRLIFVEAKSYNGQRQGGVGFGNGRGDGPQVEILLSDQLAIVDEHVRWAFADATQSKGADRYALLNCSEARAAVMGVVAKGKQNNFRLSALKPHFVGWGVFSKRLLEFFAAARGAAV